MIIYHMQHLIPNTLYKKGTSRKTQKFATKLATCHWAMPNQMISVIETPQKRGGQGAERCV